MLRSAARSVSLLVAISLFSSIPCFAHIEAPSELCAIEGCKWEEEACLCPRDIDQIKHDQEARDAKDFREALKRSTPYLTYLFGAFANFLLSGILVLNGIEDSREKVAMARRSLVALFLGHGIFCVKQASDIRSL